MQKVAWKAADTDNCVLGEHWGFDGGVDCCCCLDVAGLAAPSYLHSIINPSCPPKICTTNAVQMQVNSEHPLGTPRCRSDWDATSAHCPVPWQTRILGCCPPNPFVPLVVVSHPKLITYPNSCSCGQAWPVELTHGWAGTHAMCGRSPGQFMFRVVLFAVEVTESGCRILGSWA